MVKELELLLGLIEALVAAGRMDDCRAVCEIYTAKDTFYRAASVDVERPRFTRSALLPPGALTPWHKVLNDGGDRELMQFLGFDHATFDIIAEAAALVLQRPEEPHVGRPHLLDTIDVIGLTLRYLTCRGGMDDLQLTFGATPACVSRELRNGLFALVVALPTLPEADVYWPSLSTMIVFSDAIRGAGVLGDVEGAPRWEPPADVYPIGFLDGCALPIEAPPTREDEQLVYNGFRRCCCVNNIFLFGPDGCILYYIINAPGRQHDSRCATLLYEFLREDRATRLPPPFCILADAGFRGAHTADMIVTPLVEGEPLPADEAARGEVLRRNRWIIFHRQAVEWGLRNLQFGFQRIKNTLSSNSLLRECLLKVVVHLFNLRTRRLGHNEILAEYLHAFVEAAAEYHAAGAPRAGGVDDEL